MVFRCKNCGGNVIYSPARGTMYCPHCNGENQLETEGVYKSDYVIPFQLNKEQAWKLLKKEFKRAVTTPDSFLDESALEQIQGIYIPYWFCDYKSNYDFASKGIKRFVWREIDMEYVESDYYHVVRNMDVAFKQFPVHASQLLSEETMQKLEPYDYSRIDEFRSEYLESYEAETYQLTGEELERTAKKKMGEKAEKILYDTLGEYTELMPEDKNLYFWKENESLVLLPVWKYHYSYRNQDYDIYMNGQTGKAIGTAPVSWHKTLAYTATVLAGSWALIALIINFLEVL